MDLLKGDRCMDLCWCVVPMDFTLPWILWCNIFTPDDKLCKGDGVNNVIMFVPINNGICTKAHVDEAVNDPHGVLIKYTPEIIAVSTGEELYTNIRQLARTVTTSFSVSSRFWCCCPPHPFPDHPPQPKCLLPLFAFYDVHYCQSHPLIFAVTLDTLG